MNDPSFFWAVGIENTSMPDLGVDELRMAGHDRRWRDDLDLAASLGVSHIRHGIPWDQVHVAPDRFEWAWVDDVIDHLHRVRLEPIWDLVHFGAPAWLPGGLLDPAFPDAFAAYAGEFAARYRGRVSLITTFNEPYICAWFRGGTGAWPPHDTGFRGFVRVLEPILDAVHRANHAIRRANPDARLWLNDGADRFTTLDPALEALAADLTLARYAAFDVLEGRAAPGSETHEFLTRHGANAALLERLHANPAPVDAIGLDYYPGTEHRIRARTGPRRPWDWGRVEAYELEADPEPAGIAATLAAYHERYAKPVYVSETSAEHHRGEWLEYSTSEVAVARERGVPAIGFTWWPLFDHVDWNSGLTRLEGHVCPSGLYHLSPTVLDRAASATVEDFARLVRAGAPRDLGRRVAPIPAPHELEPQGQGDQP